MVTLHIDSLPGKPNPGDRRPPTYGSMTLVDLAGSERPKSTGSTGILLREAGHINRSLYTLAKVIQALTSPGPGRGRGPFRDSSLTKLLIGSLGGSGKTLMLTCVSAAQSAVPESLRALRFAMQVKGIQNRPVLQLDPREKLIQDLRSEIQRLRLENAQLRRGLMASAGSESLHQPWHPDEASPAAPESPMPLPAVTTIPAPPPLRSQSPPAPTRAPAAAAPPAPAAGGGGDLTGLLPAVARSPSTPSRRPAPRAAAPVPIACADRAAVAETGAARSGCLPAREPTTGLEDRLARQLQAQLGLQVASGSRGDPARARPEEPQEEPAGPSTCGEGDVAALLLSAGIDAARHHQQEPPPPKGTPMDLYNPVRAVHKWPPKAGAGPGWGRPADGSAQRPVLRARPPATGIHEHSPLRPSAHRVSKPTMRRTDSFERQKAEMRSILESVRNRNRTGFVF